MLHEAKVKDESAKRKQRRQAKQKEPVEPMFVNKQFSSMAQSINWEKRNLSKDTVQKKAVVKALFEESIPASPRKVRFLSVWLNIYAPESKIKSRKAIIDDNIKRKLDKFLSQIDISFTLPGWNNQVYLGKGDDGKHKYQTKKYLLQSFQELATLLKQEEDDNLSSVSFTMLYWYISCHKEYFGRSKIHQVNCLCPVCENLELLLTGIKKNWQYWHSNKVSWFAWKSFLQTYYSGIFWQKM